MATAEGKGAVFSRKRFLWVVLFAALLTLFVIVFFMYVRCGDELATARKEGEALQAKLDVLQSRSVVPQGDAGQLKEQGFSKLEEDLATDLMQHRELIPYKGVLGGTMGFYSQKDIHVLTSRWVLAAFEDGHIGGHMLLEYTVSPGGEIQWKVISSYLD